MKTKMGIVGCLVNRSVRLVRAVWSDVGMDPKDAAQAFVAGVIMAIPVMAVVWATAWEFFFTFEGKKTYGKIMLVEDRKKVRLYSAHLPEKPRLRCE